MILDINVETVLQQGLQSTEQQINDYAQDLALLGDIDSARKLVSAQLTAPPLTNGTYANQLLHFAWHASGHLPEGLQACLLAIKSEPPYAYGWDVPLVKALDISLRLHGKFAEDQHDSKRRKLEPSTSSSGEEPLRLSDLGEQSATLVKQIVDRWHIPGLILGLSSAERLWPYFTRSILADAFGLTREEVKAKGKIIVETCSKRLHSHPAPFPSKSMQELLQMANENTLKNTREDYWTEEVVPTTLLHDPATDSDIEELEERSDVVLPEDFKEFLRCTNGFGSGERGIFNGVFPDPNIRGTKDVKWRDCEEEEIQVPIQLLDLPIGIERLVEPADDNFLDTPLPLTRRVLELAEVDVDVSWLIPPEQTKEAVAVYRAIYEAADAEQKRVVDRAVEVGVGSWQELDKLGWCCLIADLGTPAHKWHTSLRQYLEQSAWGSGKVYEE